LTILFPTSITTRSFSNFSYIASVFDARLFPCSIRNFNLIGFKDEKAVSVAENNPESMINIINAMKDELYI
jgi:hypothetical protein